MYKNQTKMSILIIFWMFPNIVCFTGATVFFGILGEARERNIALSMCILFFLLGCGCVAIAAVFWRKFFDFMTVNSLNNLFEADEDGIVPLSDISKETGVAEEKLLKRIRRCLRKGYLINLNYSESERTFYLSDKATKPKSVMLAGAPENKPFIGVHCPSCAASLKIRSGTAGTCPYCGRQIIAPEYVTKEK